MRIREGWGRGVAAAALLLAAAVAGTAGPPADRQPVGIGDVYLSFGGYMADGDKASDPDTTAYPALLLKNYLEPAASKPVQIVDLGRDEGSRDQVERFIGDYRTSPDSTSSMALVMQALRDAKAQGQRVSPITVEMGGEDILVALQTDLATVPAALELLRDQLAYVLDELVDAVTDASGRRTADIVLVTYYNPFGSLPEGAVVGPIVDQLNGVIRKMARTRGLGVADVDRAFAGKEAALLDGVSPNDEGHKIIAGEIMKATGYILPAAGN
jgi:lysophospholipase L1-like esterase